MERSKSTGGEEHSTERTRHKYKTLRPCLEPNARKYDAWCYYCPRVKKGKNNGTPK